jgi:predicted ATPase
MARLKRPINLPAPYLRRVWLDTEKIEDKSAYPFCLPIFKGGFELSFDKPITIIVGENGAGKSTLLEALAALAGFNPAGGAKGHAPIAYEEGVEIGGDALAPVLKASWMPKISWGWFFRAESFYAVARYLDAAGSDADFLSHSHGEGFLRVFEERCSRQGLFIFDEPESALSPSRQIEFLKILRRISESGVGQVIMATHAPILMACPDAALLRLDKYGLYPTELEDIDHFRLMREFISDPKGFLEMMLN